MTGHSSFLVSGGYYISYYDHLITLIRLYVTNFFKVKTTKFLGLMLLSVGNSRHSKTLMLFQHQNPNWCLGSCSDHLSRWNSTCDFALCSTHLIFLIRQTKVWVKSSRLYTDRVYAFSPFGRYIGIYIRCLSKYGWSPSTCISSKCNYTWQKYAVSDT